MGLAHLNSERISILYNISLINIISLYICRYANFAFIEVHVGVGFLFPFGIVDLCNFAP